MPELPELRIMSDFINQNSKHRFIKAFHVEKGNQPVPFTYQYQFNVKSDTNGKELLLNFYNRVGQSLDIWVFMGMNGNWKYVPTKNWNDTKFVRMRLDDESGNSLLLYGGFMGPKYSVAKPFDGTKRGSDPTKKFDDFKSNILNNLNKKAFDKPICEVLLNQEYFNGIGAYLNSEIVGRLDINPFRKFKSLKDFELEKLFSMILKCCKESYEYGGGELISWVNPISESRIDEWIKFYNKKDICYKQQFGKRNIWIQKKFKNIS